MFKSWDVGMNIRILEFGDVAIFIEILNFWKIGILDYWNILMLDHCNISMLENWDVRVFENCDCNMGLLRS